MNNKIKGILFDLDGTVLDTQKMNIIPLQKLILEELGEFIFYDELVKYCAYPGKKTIELLGIKNRKQYEIDFIPTGLEKYVQCIVLAEDTVHHKPDPEPLLLGSKLLNLNPQNLIYVGDTFADEIASKKAGMKFALASWGASDISNINPDFLLKLPRDILNLYRRR